jgi:hypothetical protein
MVKITDDSRKTRSSQTHRQGYAYYKKSAVQAKLRVSRKIVGIAFL